MRTISGIYKITNSINGKIYVGSAVNFNKRWNLHKANLRGNTHHSRKLQNSWNKHSEESFKFSVLEYVEDLEKLVLREQFWIDELNPDKTGYNISPTAGSVLGVKRTAETRKKMSESGKGKKKTKEQCIAMSLIRIGGTHTGGPKISAALKGIKRTDEHKAKISAAKTGVKRKEFSEEWRANLSKAIKGKVKSAEWQANIIAAKKKKKNIGQGDLF